MVGSGGVEFEIPWISFENQANNSLGLDGILLLVFISVLGVGKGGGVVWGIGGGFLVARLFYIILKFGRIRKLGRFREKDYWYPNVMVHLSCLPA